MIVEHDVDLGTLTTFRTRGARARAFYRLRTAADVEEFAEHVRSSNSEWFVLGDGSNVLVTRSIELVARVEIAGQEILEEDDSRVRVRLGAGEQWHRCVEWAVQNGWAGIEAMALIPGTVGAAPIQNIGAYGQQLSDVCLWVEGYDVASGTWQALPASECHFEYRDSIFKHQLRDRFIVTAVALELRKSTQPQLCHGELERALQAHPSPTIADVFETVVQLRTRKLPPASLGNAGSFFKNPIVPVAVAEQLAQRYPTMPIYQHNGAVKLSAGWLIEQCGFKGIRDGEVGVYDRHALVLVNYGAAQAEEVLRLAERIKAAVRERFGIELEEEVVIV